jgi:hypothetical protein
MDNAAAPESHPPKPADQRLRDIWRSFSAPRRASCLAWFAFLITWVITRLITIHGKGSSTSAAITIAGHHIHHYLLGLILLGLIAAAALFWRPSRGWQFLGLGFGVALALILDEYALLLNLSDVYWKSQGRLSVDVVLAFLAAGGAYLAAMTWVHESLRRAGRRVRRPTHRRSPSTE